MAKSNLKFPLFSAFFPRLATAVGFWLAAAGLLPTASLSQVPEVPAAPQASPSEGEAIPNPPPTLSPGDVPQGYSPAPYNPDTSRQFNRYRLDIGDAVSVSVEDYPEFSFSSALDPDGKVRVPLLGQISLVGLTLEEVEAKISYELGRRYLKEDPKVIASLAGFRPAQITVFGEVLRPGFYTVGAGTPLTAILQQVGGSTPRADLRQIVVRRQLVDGTVLEEKVDLYTPLIQGKKLPDFRLQGGDAVIVSKLQAGADKGYDRLFIARTSLTQPTIIVRVIAPTFPTGKALRDLTLRNGSTYLDALAALPPEIPWITKEEVVLLRFDQEQGKIISQSLNRLGGIEDPNIAIAQFMPLENNDVIIISRTLYGKFLEAFNLITQPIQDLFGFTNTIFGIVNTVDYFDNNNN
jgi:polysaccharide export outer membrane protein